MAMKGKEDLKLRVNSSSGQEIFKNTNKSLRTEINYEEHIEPS